MAWMMCRSLRSNRQVKRAVSPPVPHHFQAATDCSSSQPLQSLPPLYDVLLRPKSTKLVLMIAHTSENLCHIQADRRSSFEAQHCSWINSDNASGWNLKGMMQNRLEDFSGKEFSDPGGEGEGEGNQTGAIGGLRAGPDRRLSWSALLLIEEIRWARVLPEAWAPGISLEVQSLAQEFQRFAEDSSDGRCQRRLLASTYQTGAPTASRDKASDPPHEGKSIG
ncbi:hypothetical protein BKA80DRAFT_258652 [Phyllosticta citrichinensis]